MAKGCPFRANGDKICVQKVCELWDLNIEMCTFMLMAYELGNIAGAVRKLEKTISSRGSS